MFIDALNLLSDAQALSATGYSTDTIDNGAPLSGSVYRDIGEGEQMELVVSCDVALAGTTPTLDIQFVQSANANLSSHDVLAAAAQVTALAAGAIVRVPVPPAVTKRYVGARFVLGGTTPTVTVTAFLQPKKMAAKQKPDAYLRNYTIS